MHYHVVPGGTLGRTTSGPFADRKGLKGGGYTPLPTYLMCSRQPGQEGPLWPLEQEVTGQADLPMPGNMAWGSLLVGQAMLTLWAGRKGQELPLEEGLGRRSCAGFFAGVSGPMNIFHRPLFGPMSPLFPAHALGGRTRRGRPYVSPQCPHDPLPHIYHLPYRQKTERDPWTHACWLFWNQWNSVCDGDIDDDDDIVMLLMSDILPVPQNLALSHSNCCCLHYYRHCNSV